MIRHIAHFIDTKGKGGAEVTASEIAIAQKKQGYTITIFHPGNNYTRYMQEIRIT